MKVALGSDHAGFTYKEEIEAMLVAEGHEVKDFGTSSRDMVDYPRYVRPAAEAVARGECERGIVLGGSGNGEAIVANKVKGVRSAGTKPRRKRAASTTTRTSFRSGRE